VGVSIHWVESGDQEAPGLIAVLWEKAALNDRDGRIIDLEEQAVRKRGPLLDASISGPGA
jgi:hypothetical protein